MVRELADLVELFGTPFISGKDSSAGSTYTDEGLVSVPPAVFLSAIGKVSDKAALLSNQWKSPGNLIVRVGPDCSSLAGTLAARIFRKAANDVDGIDAFRYKEYLEALSTLPTNLLRSGAPIGVGGVLAQLILGVLASGYGIELLQPPRGLGELLAEHRCGAIIEVSEDDLAKLPAVLRPRIVARLTGERQAISYQADNLLSRRAIDIWHTAYEESLQ
jgi:phosphoribosylformylglycinamidine synthase